MKTNTKTQAIKIVCDPAFRTGRRADSDKKYTTYIPIVNKHPQTKYIKLSGSAIQIKLLSMRINRFLLRRLLPKVSTVCMHWKSIYEYCLFRFDRIYMLAKSIQ